MVHTRCFPSAKLPEPLQVACDYHTVSHALAMTQFVNNDYVIDICSAGRELELGSLEQAWHSASRPAVFALPKSQSVLTFYLCSTIFPRNRAWGTKLVQFQSHAKLQSEKRVYFFMVFVLVFCQCLWLYLNWDDVNAA